jgi:hypothetical protein
MRQERYRVTDDAKALFDPYRILVSTKSLPVGSNLPCHITTSNKLSPVAEPIHMANGRSLTHGMKNLESTYSIVCVSNVLTMASSVDKGGYNVHVWLEEE